MRIMRRTLCITALCLATNFVTIGCTATPTSTPIQVVIMQPSSIKLGAALATKGALIGLDPSDAKAVATIANAIANDVLAATTNDTVNLTAIRQLALVEIQKGSGTARQKLIASQVVDALGLIVQDYIDNNLATMTDPAKRTATINAIRAAAAGVSDGTVLFLN